MKTNIEKYAKDIEKLGGYSQFGFDSTTHKVFNCKTRGCDVCLFCDPFIDECDPGAILGWLDENSIDTILTPKDEELLSILKPGSIIKYGDEVLYAPYNDKGKNEPATVLNAYSAFMNLTEEEEIVITETGYEIRER